MKCRICDIELNGDNTHPSQYKTRNYICKECHKDAVREYYHARYKGKKLGIYHKKRERVFKEIGRKKCEFCDIPDVHLHHIVPINNHNINHYLQNADILMPLCYYCHNKWHDLKIELDIAIM